MVGVVAAVAIAVVAPMLAPLALGVLGITATTTAVAIATAVIGIALATGLSLAFRALGIGTVGVPSAKQQVGPPSVFRQAITDSFIVYGKRRVGGLLVFFHPSTVGEDEFRYFVIACAGHQCKGLVSWMLGDEAVTVDGSGMVTSGKYANSAWLWFVRGTSSDAANSTFVAECDGQWTTAHQGLGVAKMYAKFQMTDDVVQAGMPNITAVIEGRDQIRDSRTGSTGYSRNAALIFYDWMSIPREEGGFGAYTEEVADDAWISAQANVCDESVSGDVRYAIDAVLTTGSEPGQVRDTLIVNMAGSYAFTGGKHLMRPGYWVPVSAILSEEDLAGPIQVSPFLSSDITANEVQGTYIEPDDGYQGAPFTTQSISATDIRQLELDLAFITNKDQADRVAKIMLNRAQAEKTVVWPMNIAGLKVRALDTIQLDSARYGLSNYAFRVNNWSMSADFGVVLSLSEESADIYGAPTSVPHTPRTPVTQATPILTTAELIALIKNSTVSGLTFSIADTGAVTISNHTRNYGDKSVSVTGTGGTPHAVSGAVAGDGVYIYYDDRARVGGAVAYHHLLLSGNIGDASGAFAGTGHPGRHFVCYGVVPATGGTTGGGSDVGSGGGVDADGPCLIETAPLLMANAAGNGPGENVANGDARIGELVWTRHHLTGEWMAARIVAQQRHWEPVYRVPGLPNATAEHRSSLGDEIAWEKLHRSGEFAGWAWVIKRTVADAQTYFTPGGGDIREGGVLNHNIKMTG